jgi:hypothetical protein
MLYLLLDFLRFSKESLAIVPLTRTISVIEKMTKASNTPEPAKEIAVIKNNSAKPPKTIQPEIRTHQGILPPANPLKALPRRWISPIGSYPDGILS